MGHAFIKNIALFSPAKLNLNFHVLKKREDGFHEVASLYQAINLGDYLTIQVAKMDRFTTNDSSLPLDSTNLILQALDLFRSRSAISTPLAIHLEKNIPVEAGLGGGSSNAASTLWGLNQLFNAPFSEVQLMEDSKKIGSDVAFFFSTGTAICKGRGEKVVSSSPDPCSFWVAKPNFGLKTPAVFKAMAPFLRKYPLPVDLMQSRRNDLEQAAFSISPQLKRVKEQLLQMGFEHVSMTGSGTSFFCIGKKPSSSIEGVRFYPAKTTQRELGSWYKP